MSDVAIAAMNASLRKIGNPSSLHTDGRATRKDVEDAREVIAQAVDCASSEVIFTGSGTEADNAAIKGLYWYSKKKVILVASIEHHAVLDPAHWLVDHEGAELRHRVDDAAVGADLATVHSVVHHADAEEHRTGNETVRNHLHHGALDPHRRTGPIGGRGVDAEHGEEPKGHETHVRNGRIGDKPLQVARGQRVERTVARVDQQDPAEAHDQRRHRHPREHQHAHRDAARHVGALGRPGDGGGHGQRGGRNPPGRQRRGGDLAAGDSGLPRTFRLGNLIRHHLPLLPAFLPDFGRRHRPDRIHVCRRNRFREPANRVRELD